MTNASGKIRALSVCFALALSLPVTPLYAAGSSAAAAYYQLASEAYEKGEYARADELLARAYDEEPDLIYQYNRILTNQAMGKFERALEILQTYQEQMTADPQARFTDIGAVRAGLEQQMAQAGAESDSDSDAAPVQAVPEKTAQAEVVAQPPAQPPTDSEPNILGWSLMGVGVAGLGSAALFGSTLLISDVSDNFDCVQNGHANCYADSADPASAFARDRDTWQTHRTLTWVSLGVGVAALAGSGLAFYLRASPEAHASRAASKAPEISWTPLLGAGQAGGSVHFSY